MNTRFFAWILLSISLFLLYTSWQQSSDLAKKQADERAAAARQRKLQQQEVARENARANLGEIEIAAPPINEPGWYTLGTMRPEDGYRLLVTLTSQGAGIERIELVEQPKAGQFRYRSLQTPGGYLGYLSPESVADGVLVRTVPVGSSAELAQSIEGAGAGGIQVGDVITRIEEAEIKQPIDIENSLRKFRPGRTVKVEVLRPTELGKTTIVFQCKLTQQPLDVVRVEDDFPREGVPGNLLRPSALLNIAKLNEFETFPGFDAIPGLEPIYETHWAAEHIEVENGVGIEFTLPIQHYLADAGINANLELVKRYRITHSTVDPKLLAGSVAEPLYHVDLETLVRNLDDQPHSVAIRQEGLNGLSLEGWWYSIKLSPDFFNMAGARDVILSRKSGGHELFTRRKIQEHAKSHLELPDTVLFGESNALNNRSLNYIGLDHQYFVTAFLPHPDSITALDDLSQGGARPIADVTKLVAYKDIATNTGFWFDTKTATVPANGEWSQQYRIFAGPKEPDILAKYGLTRSIYYGWSIIEWVARPLSAVLHLFYAIVQNYAVAIILLTVLVRCCMFPLSRRAAIMGQRMQEMAPEMKKINEMYKDDMQKRSTEIQALYKKYNLNPMASCLPIFIQLPIFMGLYRALSVDIALRQQPIIPGLRWCMNLAGPDMLAPWPAWMPEFIAGKGTGWFGPYLNILPIVTIVLFIVQQKVLMPKATDDQTRMTQQMMMFMTIFMGVLFFKVPAGLCLYFVTSSTWSLVERRLIKRFVPPLKPPPESNNSASAPSAPKSPPPYVPPKSNKPKTAAKSPETIADVVDSIKSMWKAAKERKQPPAPVAKAPANRKRPKKRSK